MEVVREPMHIDVVPNRGSRPAYLLRESFRDGGKVRKRTLANLSTLADDQIDLFRRWIREGATNDSPAEAPSADPADRTPTVYHAAPVVTALAFSPDGRLLAVSGYREIFLHDLEANTSVRLPGLSQRIHSLLFTADGKTLLAAGGDPGRFGELQVWDVPGRTQRHSAIVTNDTVSGASLSPDGKTVAFGATDKTIRIFDVASGKEIRKMEHHEDWVLATVFGVDGKRIVSVGRDRAAKLMNAETGAFVENVNLLREPLTALARHPKKDWVAIGGHERIPYLYRMDRPRAMRIADDSTLIRKFERQEGTITALAVSPSGQHLAVAAEDGEVRIYGLETGDPVARCSGHEGGIYALQFRPDGGILATGGFDGKVRLYDLAGKLVKEFIPVPLEKAAISQRQ